MDKTKWSYLAGLFDGEGCISIASRPHATVDKRNGKDVVWKRTSLQISIANTNLALMRWLISNFGGVFYTYEFDNQKWKTRYSWQPKGRRNREEMLLGILPYLVLKAEQANLALQYIRLPLTAEAERDSLVERCRLLNQKGKSVETNTLDTSLDVKIESELIGNNESELQVTAVA